VELNPLPPIPRSHLRTLARQSTNRPAIEVDEYTLETLAGGTGEGSQGIYRLSGTGLDQGQPVDWTLILKILIPPTDLSSDAVHSPSGFAYWKREAEALASGLLDDLPPGLSAPLCYEVSAQPDGSVWLWMEELQKDQASWTLERYGQAARRLGQWQGAYLAGKSLPEAAWLTPRTWNRDFVEENRQSVDLLRRSLDKPWVRYAYPPDVLEEFLWAWKEREVFYRILESLPQVFCHRDVFGRNLMDRPGPDRFRKENDPTRSLPVQGTSSGDEPGENLSGRQETVLIDWSYAGIGAVGEDLVPLVQASYLWREVGRETYRELEECVLSGYLEGLRAAGWAGDSKLVRLGYSAATALRYTIGTIRFGFAGLLDESTTPASTDALSLERREYIDFWTETFRRFIFPLAREAHEA